MSSRTPLLAGHELRPLCHSPLSESTPTSTSFALALVAREVGGSRIRLAHLGSQGGDGNGGRRGFRCPSQGCPRWDRRGRGLPRQRGPGDGGRARGGAGERTGGLLREDARDLSPNDLVRVPLVILGNGGRRGGGVAEGEHPPGLDAMAPWSGESGAQRFHAAA